MLSSSGKESGHESVSSDLETAFEAKAGQKMKLVLWGMFQDCAFASMDGVYGTNRVIDGVEFDFVSHLRVHNDLAVANDPGNDFAIVDGTILSWFGALKTEWQNENASAGDGKSGPGETKSVTPTNPSTAADNPTHYVVCETKVTKGKGTLGPRLVQLEKRVKCLVQRANVAEKDVGSIVALAGIGVPLSANIACENVKKYLGENQKQLPLLHSLCTKLRFFVLRVETAGDRLERLELALQAMQEEQRKAQEEIFSKLGKLLKSEPS